MNIFLDLRLHSDSIERQTLTEHTTASVTVHTMNITIQLTV